MQEFPHEQIWHYCDSPDWGGVRMEFRLIYRGPLPCETSRRSGEHRIKMLEAKQKIRAFLHPQIKEYWHSHPSMKIPGSPFTAQYTEKGLSFWDFYANQNKVTSSSDHIHRFVPLITEGSYHGCAVNVLFLRRDTPNGALMHQGDLDNRIKVLFDALRMPKESQEIEDLPQSPDCNPCFCLMKDDKYIDHVSVTTDRILTPMETGEAIDDVLIVIHVIARVVNDERSFYPA